MGYAVNLLLLGQAVKQALGLMGSLENITSVGQI